MILRRAYLGPKFFWRSLFGLLAVNKTGQYSSLALDNQFKVFCLAEKAHIKTCHTNLVYGGDKIDKLLLCAS
jgi:hypothetical protein